MNAEENRLRTFDFWPDKFHTEIRRNLARTGFFATGEEEVECNFCHHRFDVRRFGDNFEQLTEYHRLLEPHCDFIANTANCGNVPFDLLVESNRLATFHNWPNPNISPQSLAKAGFFYLNRSDEVKCAWCKGVIAKWEKQDNAFEEHQRFFPDCPRVQLGPLIEMASVNGIRDLGIQQISPPKKPKFSSLDARLRTYENWPITDIQRPETLAQAGLYYQEVDDQVRCFHCNIGLRSWQKEDDPWFEHAKWYPQCQFVQLVKGQEYVKQVNELIRTQKDSATACQVMKINDAMSTPPVLQALEIGIDGGCIRNATQRKLLLTGRPYSTVEELVKAVFGERENEEYLPGTHDEAFEGACASSIMHEISRNINIIRSVNGDLATTSTFTQSLPDNIAACEEAMPSTTQVEIPTTHDVSNSGGFIFSKPHSETEKKSNLTDDVSLTSTVNTKTVLSIEQGSSLEEENRKLKDARLCKICLDDEVGVVFLPCGHLVTCVQCAPGVNQCPMCRKDIKGFVRTYLS